MQREGQEGQGRREVERDGHGKKELVTNADARSDLLLLSSQGPSQAGLGERQSQEARGRR